MRTFKLAQTTVAALALCAGLAQAGPIVSQWKITDNAAFVPETVLPSNNAPDPNTAPFPVLSNFNQTLTWGQPAGNTAPSSLVINNNGNPFTVNTGTLTPTINITHNNFPIFATNPSNSLRSVDILATLTLQSLLPTPPGLITPPEDLKFGVKFIETPNEGTGGFCADGAAVGSGGPNSINRNGCADIFVIDQESLNFPFTYFDGNEYFFSVFANGFLPLSDAACAAAGAANGCRGFETAENLSTTANFSVLITSKPFQVPEPGSMALMGGALAALALAGRRRKQQQD